ncbi:MAG: hypothetical protein QOE70_3513 [Chthoniobacter sp.]|jgi:hypothetical protein|nr:hypothetical protein [Chthoniobacter sp.]
MKPLSPKEAVSPDPGLARRLLSATFILRFRSPPRFQRIMTAIVASLLLIVPFLGAARAAEPKAESETMAVEGLFPGGISPYLARFNEAPLGQPPKNDQGIVTSSVGYRLTRLRPGALLCLKISFTVKDPTAKALETTLHVILKQGGFDHPDKEGVALPVTAADLQPLFDAFREEELFSLPPRSEEANSGMDGHTWVFEQWRNGRYRVVARWSPQGGPAKACADAVLEFLDRFQKKP